MMTIKELREFEDALRDAGLSRTDSRKAVAVFKQCLPRDAGGPNREQRDAAAPDESREIPKAVDEDSEALLLHDALQGLTNIINAAGGTH